MPSPDFRQYVDLTIYDEQPADIYLEAIDYARAALPEFISRQGTVEDAVLQAMSFISAQTIAAINRLPNGLMEGILRLLGFERKEPTFATGTVYFTAIDTNGINIPSGTKIGYDEFTSEGGSIQHLFTTIESTFIPEGQSQSPPVRFRADASGPKPPLTTGQEMVILTSSNKLFQAFLSSTIVQGTEGEPDIEYFGRGANFIQSLTSGLVTAPQVTAHILNNHPNTYRVKVHDLTKVNQYLPIDMERVDNVVTARFDSPVTIEQYSDIKVFGFLPQNFNGIFEVETVEEDPEDSAKTIITWNQFGANASAVAEVNGSASATAESYVMPMNDLSTVEIPVVGSYVVSVTDIGMRLLSKQERAVILEDIRSRSVAGMDVNVIDAIFLPVSVLCTVAVRQGFDEAVVTSAVRSLLLDLLSPNSAPWERRIRRNNIISEIYEVDGVKFVESLTFSLNPGERLGEIDETTGDIVISYRGVLPASQVVVGVANE